MYHDDECDDSAKGQRGSQTGFLKVGLYFVIIHNDKMLKVKEYKKKVGVAILISHQTFKQKKEKVLQKLRGSLLNNIIPERYTDN